LDRESVDVVTALARKKANKSKISKPCTIEQHEKSSGSRGGNERVTGISPTSSDRGQV
jgi:hypothetical protein